MTVSEPSRCDKYAWCARPYRHNDACSISPDASGEGTACPTCGGTLTYDIKAIGPGPICNNRWHFDNWRAEPSRGAPDAAHTPGPWRTGREDMQSYDGATGEPFASVYCDDERAGMHLGERLPYLIAKTFGDECKANARLIAQAPTLLAENEKLRAGHVVLLEALRHALPILIGAIAFVDCKAVVAEVRAAIQQAERTCH